ncbi:MAG: hypothetical protein ACI9IV_000198, partial [Paracoccaceae bacterium]
MRCLYGALISFLVVRHMSKPAGNLSNDPAAFEGD